MAGPEGIAKFGKCLDRGDEGTQGLHGRLTLKGFWSFERRSARPGAYAAEFLGG